MSVREDAVARWSETTPVRAARGRTEDAGHVRRRQVQQSAGSAVRSTLRTAAARQRLSNLRAKALIGTVFKEITLDAFREGV